MKKTLLRGEQGIEVGGGGGCITASGNILDSGNLFFREFKRQLKVISKNICYLYSLWVNQVN